MRLAACILMLLVVGHGAHGAQARAQACCRAQALGARRLRGVAADCSCSSAPAASDHTSCPAAHVCVGRLANLQARRALADAQELAAPELAPGPEDAGPAPAPAPADDVTLAEGAVLLAALSDPCVQNRLKETCSGYAGSYVYDQCMNTPDIQYSARNWCSYR